MDDLLKLLAEALPFIDVASGRSDVERTPNEIADDIRAALGHYEGPGPRGKERGYPKKPDGLRQPALHGQPILIGDWIVVEGNIGPSSPLEGFVAEVRYIEHADVMWIGVCNPRLAGSAPAWKVQNWVIRENEIVELRRGSQVWNRG